MKISYDILCVGNATLDAFLSFPKDSGQFVIDEKANLVTLAYGGKIDVQNLDFSVGGNGANVAVGLSRLGVKTALCAEIGDDEFALKIVNNLARENIDRSLIHQTRGSASSFTVALNFGSERTLFVKHVKRSHDFHFENVDAKWVFLTSLGDEWQEAYRRTLELVNRTGAKLAFNPGSLQLADSFESIARALERTDWLFVNKEEGEQLIKSYKLKVTSYELSVIGDKLEVTPDSKSAELPNENFLVHNANKDSTLMGVSPASANSENFISSPRSDTPELLEKLQELGPKNVVVTDSVNGSYVLDEQGNFYSHGIVKCEAVEKTGAGDGYTSAFLAGIMQEAPISRAMEWGARNAAAVVSEIGAQKGLLTQFEIEKEQKQPGHAKRPRELYILAFDHRSTFSKNLFGGNMTKEQEKMVKNFKMVIYSAFKKAIVMGIPKEDAAILVDEQFGDEVLRDAHNEGYTTILTAEKSGAEVFTFEYGDDFAEHIKKYDPEFVKILIYYNPEDSLEKKNQQIAKLKIINNFARANNYKFLLEVLIPASPSQLAEAGGDQEIYDKMLRGKLSVDMIRELQEAQIEVDVWKLEGMESAADYQKVVAQARAGGRENVGVVVLGRGAGKEKVEQWLEDGAKVPGVIGFAVGRTIFWDSIVAYNEGKMSREQAVDAISERFYHFYQVFTKEKSH